MSLYGLLERPASASGVDKHVYHASGEAKTVCTSHVLAAFGIDASTYRYSGRASQRAAILRRNDYAVRSRLSKLRNTRSVGAVRQIVKKLKDPAGTRYMLVVTCGFSYHNILLDSNGVTIVDTAPREFDRRRVIAIHAVFKML